jgi:hypothetical protein
MIPENVKTLLLYMLAKAIFGFITMGSCVIIVIKLHHFKGTEYTRLEVMLASIMGILLGIGIILAVK